MHDSSSASSVGGGVNRQAFQQWLDDLSTEEVNRLCSLKLEELASDLGAYPRSLLNRVSVVESAERRDGAEAEHQDSGIFSRVINLFSAVYSYFVAPEEPEEQQDPESLTYAREMLKMTQRARFIDSLDSWVSEDGLDDEERAARTEAAEKLRTNFNTQGGEPNPAWPECVEFINLSRLRLRSLPPCIGVFTRLKALDLSNTQIHALPPEIDNLVRLERLYLHGVPIDSLPYWMGNLVQLQSLDHMPPSQRASFEAALGELRWLSAELFAELIACSLVEGCSLEDRVEPQHPGVGQGLEGIQARLVRLGRSALASLDAATLCEVIRKESASERRILEDLDRYVANAPEGELEDRKTVRARIYAFCQNPGDGTLILSSLAISRLPEALAHLSALTALELFDCPHLQSIEVLSNLPALRKVSLIFGSELRTLKGLPATLEELHLYECPYIENVADLSSLPALRKVNLQGCMELRNLEGLRNLLALEELDLTDCYDLESVADLSSLPALRKVNLQGCMELRNLEGLRNLLALEELDLTDCDHLENVAGLSNLLALRKVSLRNCRKLRTLEGPFYLPALVELDLWGCTHLENVESLYNRIAARCRVILPNGLVWVRAGLNPGLGLAQDERRIDVARPEIQECPKRVLAQVAEVIAERPLAIKVKFLGEPGIDAGGLSKSLWTDLGKALFGENELTKLPATRSGVDSAEKPEGDGWLPAVRGENAAEDKENLVRLGRMISWGASRPDRKLLLPPVFSPDLFAGLHAHISGEEPLVVLRMLLHDRSLELLAKPDWSDEEWPDVEALAEIYLDLPEHDQRTYIAAHLSELQEAILADPRNEAHLAMITALAEGLEQGAPGELEILKALSPAQIQERYQGSLDADRFKAALSCREHTRLSDLQGRSAQEEERLKLLTARLEWLGNWIVNPLGELDAPTVEQQAQCDQLRQRLLNDITGRGTLLDGEKVFLVIVGDGQPPSFHTCYNRLDMPQNIATEEDFRAALTSLTDFRDEGYNQA